MEGLVREGVDFPAGRVEFCAESAPDCAGEFDGDEVTAAARRAFGVRYLFAWQRVVVANILDAYAEAAGGLQSDAGAADGAGGLPSDAGAADCAPGLPSGSGSADTACRGRQIVLLPTGAGKSLCFLVPALLLPGPTLVLYPLLALMADQKRRMDSGGIRSVVFRGGQTEEEREENFRLLREGAKVILANPEVLQSAALVRRLSRCGICHVAVDEAHCVSEWGDSFRPAYLTLGDIIRRLGVPVVTAFTATASAPVLERVSEVLFGGSAHIVRGESDRPNIHYRVVNAFAKKRMAFRLAVTEQKPLLIFCGTRARSEDMARELAAYLPGDRVRFYHAGLDREEKTATERWFYGRNDAVLCCTCAYGMGVDKQDIRTVIHLECPRNAEAYVQEAGRAARDGGTGNAILLWSHDDDRTFGAFPEGSRERVMARFAGASTCRRQILLDALGGEQAVCDGCDVCARNAAAPFAEDARLVLRYVAAHRKQYTDDELCCRLVRMLNDRDRAALGCSVWSHDDVQEVLRQLRAMALVRTCLFPWRHRVTCGIRPERGVAPVFRGEGWRRLQSAERHAALLRHTVARRVRMVPGAWRHGGVRRAGRGKDRAVQK